MARKSVLFRRPEGRAMRFFINVLQASDSQSRSRSKRLLTSLWAWRETKAARESNVAELPTRLKMAFRTSSLVATLLVLDAAVIGYVV